MNTPLGCGFRHEGGAYVLGALSPADRLRFERHLRGCARCTRAVRELAGLPGLLGRVDPAVLGDVEGGVEGGGPLPDSLLPALARRAHRDRRRRALATVGVSAAVAAVAAGLAPVVVSQVMAEGTSQVARGEGNAVLGSAPRPMQPVGEVPVQASLALESVTWGTRLDLLCTYEADQPTYELPPEVTYALVVRTRGGVEEQVGTWRSVDGRTMRLSAATAATSEQISSVEVRTPGGRVVLRLTT